MDENYVVIRGRLGDNPDIREKIATIRVATNTYWRDASGAQKSKTTWVTIVMFDKNISIAQAYLRQGTTVKITGHLQTSNWKDGATGEPRSKLEIVADDIAIVPVVESTGATHQAEPDRGYQAQDHNQQPGYDSPSYREQSQPAAQAQPARAVPSRRPVASMRRPMARPVAQPAQAPQSARPVAQSSVGVPPPPPRPREPSRSMPPAQQLIPTVDGKEVNF